MRPLVFLDCDGVVNDHAAFPNGYCGTKWECVQRLNRIIAETDCDLVVSSAWRYMIDPRSMTIRGFANLLLSHGVECWREVDGEPASRVIGCTPRDEDIDARGRQIREWLNLHGDRRPYVVLDDGGENPDGSWHDMGIGAEGLPVVWTAGKVGLTDADADRVIAMLKGEVEP